MGWLSLKIVWQRRCSILFSMHMFMPVVPAIPTRIERYCSQFREYVFGLLIVVIIVL